jgi:hypothetical protein
VNTSEVTSGHFFLLEQHAEAFVFAEADIGQAAAFLVEQAVLLSAQLLLLAQHPWVSMAPGLAVVAFWLQPARRAAAPRAAVKARVFISSSPVRGVM